MNKELDTKVQQYRERLLYLDREYTAEIALKKKKDLRKLVYSGSNNLKKEAMEIVWADV